MAVNVLRRAAITLAVYIAAFLGILLLQFSGGSKPSLAADAPKINSPKSPASGGKKALKDPLYVSADGITFFIDRKSPLTAVLDTGEEVALEMRSLTKDKNIKEEDVFTVGFDRGVSLSFFLADSSGEGGGAVRAAIDAEIPEGIARVSLAFSVDSQASLESSGGAIAVSTESGFYLLEGANLAGTQPDKRRLAISASRPHVAYTRFEILEEASLEAIAKDASASEEVYLQAAESLGEAILYAYQAAVASNAVTESLAAAYLAESARRGNLTTARGSIPQSFLDSDERSYGTSPYIGGVEAAWRKWRADNERELAAYMANFQARNPAIFEKKGLVAFLIANRRADDFIRLAELAAECAGRGSLTPRQAAGVMELSANRRLLPRAVPNVDSGTIAICEEIILKSLRYFPARLSARSSLYIEESDNAAATMSALEIASILYQWGTANEEKSEWAAAARLVLATALGLARDDTSLPAVIAVPGRVGQWEDRSSGSAEATIPLAAVYPLIEPLASWYPQAVAVYPRYCIWTCATSARLYFPRAGVLDIEVEFSAGQPHYLVIHGVQDFYGIQSRGTTYDSDARFEASSAPSCMYIAGDDTLFIKIRQGEASETVRIFYSNPNR